VDQYLDSAVLVSAAHFPTPGFIVMVKVVFVMLRVGESWGASGAPPDR